MHACCAALGTSDTSLSDPPHHVSRHEQRHSDSCIRTKTEGTFHPSACSSGLNERAKLLCSVPVFLSTLETSFLTAAICILLPGQHCSYHNHPWNSNAFPQSILVFTISATILLEEPHRYWDFSPRYFHFRKIKGQDTIRAAFQKLI